MTATTTALVLYPDGDLIEITLPANDSRKIKCMAIGCRLLDVVALTSRLDMWIDDEGLYTQKVNAPATLLARHHGFVWQPYYGPVVLCSVDDEGNSINLTRDQMVGVLTHLADIAGA